MQRDAGVPAVAVYVVEAVVILVVVLLAGQRSAPPAGAAGSVMEPTMISRRVPGRRGTGGDAAPVRRYRRDDHRARGGHQSRDRGHDAGRRAGGDARRDGRRPVGRGGLRSARRNVAGRSYSPPSRSGPEPNQIITGTAITLAAVGLTGTIYRQAYGDGGAGLGLADAPGNRDPGLSRICRSLGPALFHQPAPTYLALAALPAVWWVLFRTRLGLALRAAGESAAMARAAGVRPPAGFEQARHRGWRRSPGWRGRRWCWRRWEPSRSG